MKVAPGQLKYLLSDILCSYNYTIQPTPWREYWTLRWLINGQARERRELVQISVNTEAERAQAPAKEVTRTSLTRAFPWLLEAQSRLDGSLGGLARVHSTVF